MLLPPGLVAAGSATATLGNDAASPSPTSLVPGVGSENWSSLIGIITAIVGNILISFALNTQRYAHIRLEREWQEKERQRKKRSSSYRGSQVKSPQERPKSKISRKPHPPRHAEYTVENEREEVEDGYIATEADPLLPSPRSNGRSRSRPTLTSNETGSDDGMAPEEAYKQKSYLKSPYWWAGIIMMTTGEAGNFLAYGFAPASIVSPLGVVALISNCIIAPFMLKEPFRKRDALGVLIAVAGAVTVVASASDNNPKLGPDEIWDLITTWEFETYLGITIAVIIGLTILSNRFGDRNILIDLGLVGLFGGYTALSTKGVASMLSYTLWRAITFPVTYLLVAILVFTAVMQIKYINRALQRFDATQVIPVQFVLFTLSVILGSAILYRDFERTSGDDAGKFVGGCAMTFMGVWFITSGRQRRTDEEEDREPEGDDSINLTHGDRYHDHIDGPHSLDEGSSRRSSTVRATSPPLAIDTRVSGRSPSVPSTPDIQVTPQSSFPNRSTSPHRPETPSPLTMNPWEQSDPESPSSRFPPPPMTLSRHTTLSAPDLPLGVTPPPIGSRSSPDLPINTALPHTPTRGISDTVIPVTPGGTPNPLLPRPARLSTAERLGSRNSVSGPLLASPLSTSISTMVADLKRSGSLRGVPTHSPSQRHRPESPARRRESVLGIGASEVDEREVGEPLDRRRTATDDVPSQVTTNGRGRSFSGTLGELWRGIRGGTESEDGREEGNRDIERGGAQG